MSIGVPAKPHTDEELTAIFGSGAEKVIVYPEGQARLLATIAARDAALDLLREENAEASRLWAHWRAVALNPPLLALQDRAEAAERERDEAREAMKQEARKYLDAEAEIERLRGEVETLQAVAWVKDGKR